MAKTKQQTTQSTDVLHVTVEELKKEIHRLSQENAKRQLKTTTLLRTKKDELARILTQLSVMRFAVKNQSVQNKSGKEETK